MNFDRNTVIGIIVLAVLFIGYFVFTGKEQAALRKRQAEEMHRQDSIAKANAPKIDTLALKKDSLRLDSLNKVNQLGIFKNSTDTAEKLVTVENDVMKVTFTNKGGQVRKVELKNFKGPDSTPVKLAATNFDKISYRINTGNNNSGGSETSDLFFSKIDSVSDPDGSKKISFTLLTPDSTGRSITHEFIVKKNDYLIDFTVKVNRPDLLFTNNNLNLAWQYAAVQQESDINFEKQNTQIGFVANGDFDYHSMFRRSSQEFDKPVQWIGVRQRFFNTILVAKNNFTSGKMEWAVPPDNEKTILRSTADLQIKLQPASQIIIPFSIYYGPADYHILRKYDMKFDKLINLGQGIYSFVRPINRFLVMPVFDFMKNFVGSYGLAIALLTIIIRLLISPLTYSSYLSGAKMKVLRPEIAALKAKFGGDQQQMSMEQMKLFREAGVNPLGGCIPALLQIPIFFALYSFFNSNIALRGENFLWANDLSAYDVIVKLPFSGATWNHISLFTIAACATSFLISLYSMSMTPDQSNPMLKYMPYIFPFFLLFIFNRLPSGLTWYYTVSNIITLALQYVIQKYIIDHDKILAKIEEKRKQPKAKSKWQERFEQMQQQQKKLKEMQQKAKR